MRLDKYLKNSRLVKRRTIANELCDKQRVKINGNIAKASTHVKVNDIIEITFGASVTKVKVTDVFEHATKANASKMYTSL